MAAPDRNPSVPELGAEIEGRTAREAEALSSSLRAHCWPASSDSIVPMAVEWVRRWGPARSFTPSALDCTCVAGRCAVCN